MVKTPPRWANALLGGGGKQKKITVLFLISFLCFASVLSLKGYQTYQQNVLSFSQPPELTAQVSEELFPSQILISSLGIDLPVSPAEATGSAWEISEKGSSYLLGSGVPGQKGNVVIYGHNKNKLFGPIRWLGKGEEIKVVNKREEEFVYEVVETKTVTPDNVEVLAPTEDATLTLYTCTGFLDSKRFIVVAKLQPEQK